MRKVENECRGCAVPGYPCLGKDCPNREVVHYYCDECGADIDLEDELFYEYGQDLCLECLKARHRKDWV